MGHHLITRYVSSEELLGYTVPPQVNSTRPTATSIRDHENAIAELCGKPPAQHEPTHQSTSDCLLEDNYGRACAARFSASHSFWTCVPGAPRCCWVTRLAILPRKRQVAHRPIQEQDSGEGLLELSALVLTVLV